MVTQEQLDNILREPERWKAIERNPLETDDLRFVSGAGENFEKIVLSDTQVPEKRIRKLVILDTETTGITADAELIELAFCVCSYDVRTKEVLSIDCLFDAFSKLSANLKKSCLRKSQNLLILQMICFQSRNYLMMILRNICRRNVLLWPTMPDLTGGSWKKPILMFWRIFTGQTV